MGNDLRFQEVGRRPFPGDNVAIATRRLEAGTEIAFGETRFRLDYTLLEGHRFAIRPIPAGAALLSWGLPFGFALHPIRPGAYVCNAGILHELRGRRLDFALPSRPNFEDRIEPFVLDEDAFQPAEPLSLYETPATFTGYCRSPVRGVGTRNYIVLLGTTSLTTGYVRQLETRLQGVAAAYEHLDGIVAVAHTEGGSQRLHNLDLLLRTLAGFMVHPNVGAVLAVDHGWEPLTNGMLRHFMETNGYPLDDVPHHFLSLTGDFQAQLAQGEAIVKGWLDSANRTPRTAVSTANLKVALQCGGSDAFSGISGNPLASWVAREIIRAGGAANLAETDELTGAESYLLQKVRDLPTAQRFLALVERFKERASWHGQTVDENTTGGNKYRGLYNIVLKSIGAAMKRHPDVRLDYVIEYGEQMTRPGFYMMDSPGNDLESIAGQVAAGCNLIFFVTGNGSITNFPFVPTIKIVTTTRRYRLLSADMDFNAGAYLDGTPMDALGQQLFDLTLQVASGRRSVGETAGHAQVQIWRNWQQTDGRNLEKLLHAPQPDGRPISVAVDETVVSPHFQALRTESGVASDQVGLIMPASLCAGQIARLAAGRLNQKKRGREKLSRFVALVHTEGCGVSGGPSEALYTRTLLGYLSHPLVAHALLLEHGCEKTHNDFMRNQIERAGLDPRRFGWASIQRDGGIEKVMGKIEAWFGKVLSNRKTPQYKKVGLEAVRLGVLAAGCPAPEVAVALAQLTRQIVGAGGTVVVAENVDGRYLQETTGHRSHRLSLAYGQRPLRPGFHMMATPTGQGVETLTGLGATGVELIVACVDDHPMPGHPMIPVVQITAAAGPQFPSSTEFDLLLAGDPARWPGQIMQRLIDTLSHQYTPVLMRQGNLDFQITRGLLGISM